MPNNAQVTLSLKSDVSAQIAATANQYKLLSAESQRAEAASARYAKTLTQVALADAKTATEAQRLAVQTANAARAQIQAEAAALRLANAQQRAASGTSFATQTAQAFSSQISAMVSPLALAAAGMGALVATANSFKEAFAFKAELDATTASINAQLRGVRESGQVWNEASAFADKYKLTQEETTQAIAASIGVMRASKAPVEDILGVLARMQVLSPEQSLQEAAIALKALASGDTTSLVTRFEVGRDVANEMKAEIQGGADAVAVMNKFLGDTGIGMDVLATRTTGAMGAMKDLAKAQEDLQLAQAEFAQGPGMLLLQAQTNLTRDAIKLLQGDVRGLNDALTDSGIVTTSILKPLIYYNTYVLNAGRETLIWAGVLSRSWEELNEQAGASNSAAAAAQYYAGRAFTAGNAASVAAVQVEELTAAQRRQAAAQGLAEQRAGERSPGASGAAESAAEDDRRAQAIFRRLAQPAKDKAAAEAKAAQAAQARDSAARSHTNTLAKQRDIQQSITNSVREQHRSALDIEELAARDRLQDLDDAQKAKTARAILASPNANADLKGRAQATLDLISVQDRKRAAELGGVPGLPAAPGAAPLGAPGALPPAAGAAPAGGGGPLTINLVVDGKTLASVSEPYIMDTLLRAVRGARATAGA